MDAKIAPSDNGGMTNTSLFHLERRDPARNMKRFYRLAVERDLFGEILLVREWGRIGRQGRRRIEPQSDTEAALMRASTLARAKRRRGYVEIPSPA